jgi:hypothetical protein
MEDFDHGSNSNRGILCRFLVKSLEPIGRGLRTTELEVPVDIT